MSSKSTSSNRFSASRAIGSVWWYFLLRSLLLLASGGFMLFDPELSRVAFTQVIAALVIIDGGLALTAAFTGKVESRFWSILRGGLMLVAGVFVFLKPDLVSSVALKTVSFIVAPIIIIIGVFEIFRAAKGKKRSKEKGGMFSGILTTLFGILLIVAPMFFGELVIRLLGIVAILMAIPLLMLARKCRKAAKKIAAASESDTGNSSTP